MHQSHAPQLQAYVLMIMPSHRAAVPLMGEPSPIEKSCSVHVRELISTHIAKHLAAPLALGGQASPPKCSSPSLDHRKQAILRCARLGVDNTHL